MLLFNYKSLLPACCEMSVHNRDVVTGYFLHKIHKTLSFVNLNLWTHLGQVSRKRWFTV